MPAVEVAPIASIKSTTQVMSRIAHVAAAFLCGLCLSACGASTCTDGGCSNAEAAVDASTAADGRTTADATVATDITASLDAREAHSDTPVASDAPFVWDVGDIGTVDVIASTVCDDCRAPRPRAPRAGAHATARRPLFSWLRPVGVETVRVVLCRDRALTVDCVSQDAAGSSLTWPEDLPPGLWHWGLRSVMGGAVGAETSAVRRLYVGSRSGIAHTWGGDYDANGDGFADSFELGVPAGVVWLGGPMGLRATSTTSAELLGAFDMDVLDGLVGSGDIDSDGYDDAIVVAYDTMNSRMLLLRGSATGPHLTTVVPLPPATRDLISAPFYAVLSGLDVDGDCFDDVIAVGHWGRAVWFRGSAGGLVPAGLIPVPSNQIDRCYALGDIDGDGDDELACSVSDNDRGYFRVFACLGSPRGPDCEHPVIDLNQRAPPTHASDIDGDGLADYILPIGDDGDLELRLGDGRLMVLDGRFSGAYRGAFADANGDGFADGIFDNGSGFGGAPGFARGGPEGLAPPTHPVSAGCGLGLWGYARNAGDTNGDGREDIWASAGYFKYLDQRVEFGASTGLTSGGVIWEIPAAGGAMAIAVGDVNGDGRADLAIGDATGATLIYGGETGLALGPHLEYGPAEGIPVTVMPAGDLDGDHHADVILSRRVGPWRLYRSRGDAIDTVGELVSGSVSTEPLRAIAVGDMNRDGFADIAVIGYGEIQLRWGGRTGLNGPSSSMSTGDLTSLASWFFSNHDLTGDGIPDAVATVSDDFIGTRVSIYGGTPTGWARTDVGFYWMPHASPATVVLNDVTGDHISDLMTCGGSTCSLRAGGALTSVVSTFTLEPSRGPLRSLGDLDGDGFDDILADSLQRPLEGGRRWQPWGYCPTDLTITPIGDVNGDGRGDLLLDDRVQLGGVRAPGLAPTELRGR